MRLIPFFPKVRSLIPFFPILLFFRMQYFSFYGSIHFNLCNAFIFLSQTYWYMRLTVMLLFVRVNLTSTMNFQYEYRICTYGSYSKSTSTRVVPVSMVLHYSRSISLAWIIFEKKKHTKREQTNLHRHYAHHRWRWTWKRRQQQAPPTTLFSGVCLEKTTQGGYCLEPKLTKLLAWRRYKTYHSPSSIESKQRQSSKQGIAQDCLQPSIPGHFSKK